MKIYSNDAVSKNQLEEIGRTVNRQLDAIDAKQDRQIQQLRLWVAGSFVVNAVLTLVLFAII